MSKAIQEKLPEDRETKLTTIRLTTTTFKTLLGLAERINRKDFGCRVKHDDVIACGLSLIASDHVKGLQERSLSNQDRLNALYDRYAAKRKNVSKDEFLGLLLAGRLPVSVNGGGDAIAGA